MSNISYHIANLLEKMASSDKDFRFMATNDLMGELQKDSIKLDDDSERKVVKMLLRLLEDKNGEVQNLAVRCLGPLVTKVKELQVETIVEHLCTNMCSDKEQLRDISSIGLKTVISELPLTASSMAASVSISVIFHQHLYAVNLTYFACLGLQKNNRAFELHDSQTGRRISSVGSSGHFSRSTDPLRKLTGFFPSGHIGSVAPSVGIPTSSSAQTYHPSTGTSSYVLSSRTLCQAHGTPTRRSLEECQYFYDENLHSSCGCYMSTSRSPLWGECGKSCSISDPIHQR